MYTIIIIKSHWQHGFPRLSFSIRPYHPSPSVSLSNYILCPHRAKFLLVSQHWHVNVKKPIEEHHLYFQQCPTCLVRLTWFLRWEVSGRVGVHRRTSLMSSSLHLQQCPTCLVRLTWMIFEIGSKWPYSYCFVGWCFQDLFKIAPCILPISRPRFDSRCKNALLKKRCTRYYYISTFSFFAVNDAAFINID